MKKSSWFRKVRGSYLPNNKIGLAIYLAYVAYLIMLGILWYKQGHTEWQLFTVVIPLTFAAAFAAQYIASKHSK